MLCSAAISVAAPSSRSGRSRRVAVCVAACNGPQPLTVATPLQASRRGLLAAGLIGAGLIAGVPGNATAGVDRSVILYDGLGKGTCPLGTEGAECRQEDLNRDAGQRLSYEETTRSAGVAPDGTALQRRPMSDGYGESSKALIAVIREELSLDPFDPRRAGLVAAIRKDGNTWTSKFAPGGGASTPSARAIFIALSAILSHLSANGLSPLPKTLLGIVNNNLTLAEGLIVQGK